MPEYSTGRIYNTTHDYNVYVHVCVHACVHVHVCACMSVCMHGCVFSSHSRDWDQNTYTWKTMKNKYIYTHTQSSTLILHVKICHQNIAMRAIKHVCTINTFLFACLLLFPYILQDFYCWCSLLPKIVSYWAIQAGLLTPLTFARHCLSPLVAFTSGAYFCDNGRRWPWICEFYTANFKGIFGGPSS